MFESPESIMLNMAKRIRSIRRSKKISQIDLAQTSKVSYGSIKRFELTGEISLNSLIKICIALNLADELNRLFR
ncbi:MAG: helix-turn-helix domain-containing protein [bacterium]|nr:helix-turn-helix domain-containing protein [bacterium]